MKSISIYILSLSLFFPAVTFSQPTAEIQWSQVYSDKKDGTFNQFVGYSGDQMTILVYKDEKPFIQSRNSKYTLLDEVDLSKILKGHGEEFTSAAKLGERVVILSTQKKNGKLSFMVRSLLDNMTISGEREVVHVIDVGSAYYLSIDVSKYDNYLSVIVNYMRGAQKPSEFEIFDIGQDLKVKGKTTSSASRESIPGLVSGSNFKWNDGIPGYVVERYADPERDKNRNSRILEMRVYSNGEGAAPDIYPFGTDGHIIQSYKTHSINDTLYVLGFYTDPGCGVSKGVFYAAFVRGSKDPWRVNWSELPEAVSDRYTFNTNKGKLGSLSEKEVKRQEAMAFSVSGLLEDGEGDLYLVGLQQVGVEFTGMDGVGGTVTRSGYVWRRDRLIAKLGKDGSIKWSNIIEGDMLGSAGSQASLYYAGSGYWHMVYSTIRRKDPIAIDDDFKFPDSKDEHVLVDQIIGSSGLGKATVLVSAGYPYAAYIDSALLRLGGGRYLLARRTDKSSYCFGMMELK